MASIVSRGNGKYAVVYYEGEGEGEGKSRHQVWKSGLSMKQTEKLKEKKNLEEKKRKVLEKKKKQPQQDISVTDATVEEFLDGFVQS